MQDKLEKIREFIQANPGKSNRWYADNNGIIKKTTFYKYLNDIVMDRSIDTPMDRSMDNQTDNFHGQTDNLDGQTDNESASASASESASESASASASASETPTSEIIQNLLDEHEKNEDRKSKNRQYNYNTRSRKALVDELQKENEELKSKYEELKSKYEELKSKYEKLQTDFIFERELKEKYINQIHDLPFKQSEFDELKDKYERLQIEYITLKTGDKPDKSNKPETKTQWWEEL